MFARLVRIIDRESDNPPLVFLLKIYFLGTQSEKGILERSEN